MSRKLLLSSVAAALLVALSLSRPAAAQFAPIGCQPSGSVPGPCNADSNYNQVVVIGAGATPGTTGYPIGATPVMISANGTTLATNAVMPAVAAKTNYVCGFNIRRTATASAIGTDSVSGLLGGALSYLAAIGATPAVADITQTFSPCIPASGVNVAITVASSAAGTAGFNFVNVWGFVM